MASEDAPPAAGKFGDLRTRLISAFIVTAIALAGILLGGIWVSLLAAAAVTAMVLELRSIIYHGGAPAGLSAVWSVMAGLAGIVLVTVHSPMVGGLALIAGVALASVLEAERGGRAALVLAVLGTLYIGAAGIAFVALRGEAPYGLLSILWAALVVVAADVGGYFAGRIFGGPKLWPAVSPKKTWAGLAGGVILAFFFGGLFSWATTGTYFLQVCTVSMIAAVLAQAGDLGESALKRHFGVKDAGSLIPGHGGVLDRLDGHMAAVLVAAAVTFSRGEAVFVW
ncbi:MAG: phosphatidate cytidylyltransferase [Pseudomonadota bacterium]